MTAAELLSLWYAALTSPKGVRLNTDEPERLRQKLYQVRAAAADPALDDLSLVISPINPTSQVWIVRKTPDA